MEYRRNLRMFGAYRRGEGEGKGGRDDAPVRAVSNRNVCLPAGDISHGISTAVDACNRRAKSRWVFCIVLLYRLHTQLR